MIAPSPAMSTSAMSVLTALLEARTGQQIAAYRSWRLDTALKPLLRERRLQSLDQLVTQLLDGHDPGVADLVVEALVNGETSFFRDSAVFDQLVDAVAAIETDHRRPRLWCAGCATGQEPLSLAMVFAERLTAHGLAVPEIVATDVSEASLARARTGRFTQFEIQRGLPVRRMMQWFDGGDGIDGAEWVARPELVRHVSFRRANLVADCAPPGRFDIVLCRNVLLYLSPRTKTVAFERIAAALRPGGLLVLGAGETVIGQTPLFEPSRRYRGFYEAVPAAPAHAPAGVAA